MPLAFTNITCVADSHKPQLVRVSTNLSGALPADHEIRARLSSNGIQRQGKLRWRGGAFRLNAAPVPHDPVTVLLRLVDTSDPRNSVLEAQQVFDLGR